MTSKNDECSLAQNHQASSSKKKGNIGIEVSPKKDNANRGVDYENNKKNFKKGPWTVEEDALLMEYVTMHGERHWNSVQKTGLMRCGKSCRLRWINHLRPDLKKGAFSLEEERIVLDLHAKLGNKWSKIAAELPGRTDNEVKNFWNTKIKRRMKARQFIMLNSQENQPKEAISFHQCFQQQKIQNLQGWQDLPTSTNHSHSPMTSFLATKNSTPIPPSNIRAQDLYKSGEISIKSSQFNDPILSFLNNPSYKYQHLSKEEKVNYNTEKNFPLLYSQLPNVSNVFTPTNSFDIGSTNTIYDGSATRPIESTRVKIEQPSRQINYHHMPMTTSFRVNDVWMSSYTGDNLEVEKSSISEEEKGSKEMGNKRVWVNHHNSYYNNGAKRLKVEAMDEFLPMDDDLFTLLHDFSSIGSPTHLYQEASSMHNHNKEAFGLPLIRASHESLPSIDPLTLDFNYNTDNDCYWTKNNSTNNF